MSGRSGSTARMTGPVWVAGVLFAFALVLAVDPLPFQSPAPAAPRVPSWATDSTPVRRPRPQPEYGVSAFTYRCSDCHRILPSPADPRRVLIQHTEISLRHGINTNCFNCHHRTNRDALVDDFGNEIPWIQPPLVCAKCHGPVYRDWQHGVHGRTNGYWDRARGTPSRVKCIECHDPHQPPFPPMKPAPAPRTIRMGPRDFGPHAPGHDPLRLHRGKRRGTAGGAPGRGS